MPATTRQSSKGGKTSRSKSAPARTTKKRHQDSDDDNDHDEEIVELQEDKEKLERALEAQAKEMECLKKKHDEALARASQKSGRAPPSKRLKSGKGNQTIEEKRTHTLCRKGLKKVAWGVPLFHQQQHPFGERHQGCRCTRPAYGTAGGAGRCCGDRAAR